MKSIGSKIKEKREEMKLTQEELASMLGYKSKSTVNKIEMGVNDITQSKIVAFAKALNTTPSYLMGWEDTRSVRTVAKIVESEIDAAYQKADHKTKNAIRCLLELPALEESEEEKKGKKIS